MRTFRWPRDALVRAPGAALALALPFCAACAIFAGSAQDGASAPGAGRPVTGSTPPPAATATVPASPAARGGATHEPRPVLQFAYGGGLGNVPLGPPGGPDLVTFLTLWDDGRAVFRASRGAYQEARLPPETVAAVLATAADLYALGDFYAATDASDAASSGLSIETARGRKTVEAYATNPYAARPGEASHAELELLRAVWRAAVAVLPPDAPAMAPDEAIVSLSPGIGRSSASDLGCAALGIHQEWPPALAGRLAGAAAREATALAPVGPTTRFCVDGTVQQVSLHPVLPDLSLPRRNWPAGGLPRHPAATAYDAGDRYAYLYRAPGVPQAELAAWYRTQMDAKGWRLAHESPNDRQVWVRPRPYEADPLVELRYRPGQFELRYVRAEGGLPRPPEGFLGPCDWPACRLASPAPAATAWFREYLGYLGWAEVGPDLYQREWTLLRLEFRPESGGTAMNAVTSAAASPPPLPAGSLPYSVSRSTPLCEATRGGTVRIAGRTITLHESLCLTIHTPALVRIQVAYGESYLDVDPRTGDSPGAGSMSGDGAYAAHLHALANDLRPDAPPRMPGRRAAAATPAP